MARIFSPRPNATNGASSATRREAGVTGSDRGAGWGHSHGRRPPTGGRVATQATRRGPTLLSTRTEGAEGPSGRVRHRAARSWRDARHRQLSSETEIRSEEYTCR